MELALVMTKSQCFESLKLLLRPFLSLKLHPVFVKGFIKYNRGKVTYASIVSITD